MRRLAPVFALLVTVPAGEVAAAGCPGFPEDSPLRCHRAYVHVAPAGLVVPIGDVRHEYAEGPRLGYASGVGVGAFHVSGRFAFAVGGRVGYQVTRRRFDTFDSLHRYLHVGPELRIGAVGRRVFGFGLVRVGYSRWHLDYARRTSIAQTDWRGGHIGLGGGAWARLGGRAFLGGEAVLDFLLSEGSTENMLSMSMVFGLWL